MTAILKDSLIEESTQLRSVYTNTFWGELCMQAYLALWDSISWHHMLLCVWTLPFRPMYVDSTNSDVPAGDLPVSGSLRDSVEPLLMVRGKGISLVPRLSIPVLVLQLWRKLTESLRGFCTQCGATVAPLEALIALCPPGCYVISVLYLPGLPTLMLIMMWMTSIPWCHYPMHQHSGTTSLEILPGFPSECCETNLGQKTWIRG